MGTSLSRQNAAVEEADVTLNHPYKYPPRTGNYGHSNCQLNLDWTLKLHICCGVAVVPILMVATNGIDALRDELICRWSCVKILQSISFVFFCVCAGTYFGTHFIMGGERFDTPQPEAYLFGENGDLNFLGSRPTAVGVSLMLTFFLHTKE